MMTNSDSSLPMLHCVARLRRYAFLLSVGVCSAAIISILLVPRATHGIIATVGTGDIKPMAIAIDQRAGRVIVVGELGSIRIFNTHTAAPVAAARTGATSGFASIAVDSRDARAFVSTGIVEAPQGPGLLVLDTRSGAVVSAYHMSGKQHAFAVDERHNRVYITDISRNAIDVFGAQSGVLLQTLHVADPPLQIVAVSQLKRAFIETGGVSHHIDVLDTNSGKLVQTIPVGSDDIQMVASAHTNRVFVARDRSGTVSMLDARTGLVLRTRQVGADPNIMAIDEHRGRLFVGSWINRSITILDIRRLAILATVTLDEQPTSLAIDERAGRVIVAGIPAGGGSPLGFSIVSSLVDAVIHVSQQDGVVDVLDAQSGTLKAVVPVGQQPSAVVVDEITGRAFVVNETSDSMSVLNTHDFP